MTSFYGSCLWDLYSPEVNKIYSSWNVTMRNVLSLPWTSHRYFIESVSNTRHPKTMLCKFWESLRQCKKGSVRYLFSLVYDDRRNLTGRTVSKVALDCQVDRECLVSRDAKDIRYFPPPSEELWRIQLLKELLEVRKGSAEVPGVSCEDIEDIIDEICTN